MLRPFILVLYCTGLRLGEAARLHTTDVNLDRGTLMIRCSKGRSRLVVIRSDLVAELRSYVAQRQRLVRDLGRPDPEAFFLRRDASGLTVRSASEAIRRLLRQLGLKPATGRAGVRPYEFRHAFAVHRLTAWANEGVDIHTKLPLLSAYLGHLNIIGTEVYLKGDAASAGTCQHQVCTAFTRGKSDSMNKPPSQALFALVESFFTGYLPRQRGASVHTIRAYRDSLKLLFEFTAQHRRRDVASLDVADLDAKRLQLSLII